MNSEIEPIPRLTAQKLIAAASVRRITAREVPNGYLLLFVTQTADYTLNNNRRPTPKIFKSLDTVGKEVAILGARNFDVEMMNRPRSLNDQKGLFK